MSNEFFPPRPDAQPTIYAYEDSHPQYAGLLKIGYTTREVKARMAEHYPTVTPGKPPYHVCWKNRRCAPTARRSPTAMFTAICGRKTFPTPKANGSIVRSKPFNPLSSPCATACRTKNIAIWISPCGPNSKQPLKKLRPISKVSAAKIPTKRRTSCGTRRCASAKPSPPTSLPER